VDRTLGRRRRRLSWQVLPRESARGIMMTMKAATDVQVISRSPEVMSGAPVFTGTRVPVQTIIDYLAGGHPLEDFLDDFPTVSREQAIELLARLKETLKDAQI
jgi:uncharacterized protein (DUF433 family)